MSSNLIKSSKFMSLVLRHKPEEIGIELNPSGWALIEDLAAKSRGRLTPDNIREVVATSDKRRFAISEDGKRVRANQGHSVDIDLGLEALQPPDLLFHGTATRFLDSIRAKGLLAGSRQHVHLSADTETATKVGQRHGSPVVLKIRSAAMASEGIAFYRSNNGVWLTEHVPSHYLIFPDTP